MIMFLYEDGFPLKLFAKGLGISESDWINLQPQMTLDSFTPADFEWVRGTELRTDGLPQEILKFLKVGKIARFPKRDSATGNLQYIELYDKVIRGDEGKEYEKEITPIDFTKALTYYEKAVKNPAFKNDRLIRIRNDGLKLPKWAFTS
jgi:hypothetical protein